jgi:murein DD-endopeptidase MepM/ murein hydrolase activator NlpD
LRASPSLSPRRARRGRRIAAGLALSLALVVALPPFHWPIRGRVTSGFFLRHKPGSLSILDVELHHGLDIAAPAGTPVLATAPGIVAETGRSAELGNFVRVRHLLGFESVYGHLSRINVREGRLILVPGLRSLGSVGSTGRSTGPHLHFGLLLRGRGLPPRFLLVFHSLRRAIIGI